MAYGNTYTFHGVSIRLKTEDELFRAVLSANDLDFGEFGPGSGWVLAELRWQPDGSARFEGAGEPKTMTVQRGEGEDEAAYLNRVLNQWKDFTADAIVDHESRIAALRPAQALPST